MKKAVFIDRDGTLIELVHYLTDPEDVKLIDGAAKALQMFEDRGFICILITNQSAIGRGMLTIEGLEKVHEELHRQLDEEGVALDGIYFCPEMPMQKNPTIIEHHDRKPGPGMLLRAAMELNIDIANSWMIGDTISDMLAGQNAGCRGSILVKTGYGKDVDPSLAKEKLFFAEDLLDAVSVIDNLEREGSVQE